MFIWNYLKFNDKVEIDYYTDVESKGFGDSPWWEVIRSKNELLNYNKYLNLDLAKIEDINFNKNAIILSNGRKINKIIYRKTIVFLPDYSGIAYLQDKFNKNIVFVYLIDKDEKLFVDRHFGEEKQYVIEKIKKDKW